MARAGGHQARRPCTVEGDLHGLVVEEDAPAARLDRTREGRYGPLHAADLVVVGKACDQRLALVSIREEAHDASGRGALRILAVDGLRHQQDGASQLRMLDVGGQPLAERNLDCRAALLGCGARQQLEGLGEAGDEIFGQAEDLARQRPEALGAPVREVYGCGRVRGEGGEQVHAQVRLHGAEAHLDVGLATRDLPVAPGDLEIGHVQPRTVTAIEPVPPVRRRAAPSAHLRRGIHDHDALAVTRENRARHQARQLGAGDHHIAFQGLQVVKLDRHHSPSYRQIWSNRRGR